MAQLSLTDAKIFYDETGQAREVLISYETFRQIEGWLEEFMEKDDQGYFWTESWQARIREGEADVENGRVKVVSANNINAALDWLDE